MDQDSSSSRGFLGPPSEVPLNVDLESCPTASIQVSPFLNNKQQEAGSSSSSRQEPQATSEAQDRGQKLHGHGGHDTKRRVTKRERDRERVSMFDDQDRFIINHFVLPKKRSADPDLPTFEKAGSAPVTTMEWRYAPTLGRRIHWEFPLPTVVDMVAIQRLLDRERSETRGVMRNEAREKKAREKCVPVEAVINTEGLQACLKHPDITDNAQPASGAHSRGVENTTTRATATSPKSSQAIAKPSLLQSQPAPAAAPHQNDLMMLSGMLETRNTTFTSGMSDASAPPRKSLPGTSTLQVQSPKVNNDLVPRPIVNSTKTTNLPSSISNSTTRPIVNSTKKTNLPSSISNSIKSPNRSLPAASRKAYQQKKSSKSTSSSGTIAQRYKQATGSSVSTVYFKGSGSYYTPFDPTSLGVNNHSSNRAMDGTVSTEIKVRPSSGKGHLDSSSQPSQPVPGFPVVTPTSPRQGTQLAHSASNSYSNQPRTQPRDLEPSEHVQDTLEDDEASQDSELSDVESIDPRSFGSYNTASAPSRSPMLVIADSDDEDDDDDNRIIYGSDEDDIAHDDKADADKSCPYTKQSALDDAPYRICKDQFGKIRATEGALLPVGYQFFDGDFPWICPVRSCRTLHPTIKAMGNHFCHQHKAACYNDNLDGTLTFLGQYTKQLAKQRPIIVSKKAMSLDDSPMLEPSYPSSSRYKYNIGFSPERTLNDHVPRHKAQNKDAVSGQATIAVQGPSLSKPIKILTMADPDRPYNMWPDATGKLEQLQGGLLPSGWTPYYEYPQRQWICPIRSCQCLVKSRCHFGRHFLTHSGCHLNDNLDGTFTILRRSQAHLDQGGFTDTPPIVVSREPLDEEPIQPPKIRFRGPSGTQPIWVSLSSYLASTKKGHPKAVEETTPNSGPAKIRIVPSRPSDTPSKPVTEAHSDTKLIMATKDRKYSRWWDADRNLQEMHGALIPDGYDLDNTWPGRPWICPIRSCRVVCKTTWSLGAHFKRHGSVSLNDNKDGTFSIVGTHQHEAPRVVSKRLVTLHKDPIVGACLPVLKNREIEMEERKKSRMRNSTDKNPTDKTPTNKPATDPKQLWRYLCNIVERDLARPSHPSFEHLIALPRIRDLNTIDKKLGPGYLMGSKLAVCLVIQVTGVERQVKQCTACRRGDGPFKECVSICPELAQEIAESSPSLVTTVTTSWCCMNCVLNKTPTTCSLKLSLLERLEDGSVKESVSQGAIASGRPAIMVKPKEASQNVPANDEVDEDLEPDGEDATSFSYRRSGRLRSQAEATPSEPQKRPFASTDMASSISQAVSTAREEEASSLRGSKRIRATQNAPHQDHTPSAIQESLEVEDWEREAKAIPRENGPSDNLAVSSSYNLSNHQNPSTSSIQVCSSPSFSLHVIKIPSGGSHHLRATLDESSSSSSRKQQHQTRMCTVIAGKLRVKVKVGLDGEEDDTGTEFNIGLHGLFKLGKEMECKVENWGYNEAVLHVVGVRGE